MDITVLLKSREQIDLDYGLENSKSLAFDCGFLEPDKEGAVQA